MPERPSLAEIVAHLNATGFKGGYTPSTPNSLKNPVGGGDPTKLTGLSAMLEKMGLINNQGNLFGLSGETLGNIGTVAGIGKGLFDMGMQRKNYSLAKDYYNHQMGIDREQMDMYRQEHDRIAADRARLNQGYLG